MVDEAVIGIKCNGFPIITTPQNQHLRGVLWAFWKSQHKRLLQVSTQTRNQSLGLFFQPGCFSLRFNLGKEAACQNPNGLRIKTLKVAALGCYSVDIKR
jgi:hypothetical protein